MNHVVRRHRDSVLVGLPFRLVNETNAREHWAARCGRAKTQREHTALALRAPLSDFRSALASTEGRGTPEAGRPRLVSASGIVCRDTGRHSLVIVITRIGPRRLDDDNLAASGKHVRDGIADALGIDDGDSRISWMYDQRRAAHGDVTVASYGVEICVSWPNAKALSASRVGSNPTEV